MRHALVVVLVLLSSVLAAAQEVDSEPVFAVRLAMDRAPLVAAGEAQLAVVLTIDRGWHVNSSSPGDEFSVPTSVSWTLPEGWSQPVMSFPGGRKQRFEFTEEPIEVWDGEVVMIGHLVVPEGAAGPSRLRAEVTAQACNDHQCLPPRAVAGEIEVNVAAAGTASSPVNRELFAAAAPRPTSPSSAGRLAGLPLPLLLLFAFVAGLGLNLTPCVYPLIPITISIFAREAKERAGSTVGLAIAYVLGMAATYSTLGVAAALTGQLFGSALQHPVVIGVVVVVMLALAASMFGFWELQPPGWALRASGGRAGYLGALIMGLIVGFVAAPCVGPFVVGLLTVVGERGDPLLGFAVFFSLAMGLGLPYLLLGIFTKWIQKLPAAGGWMEGVRKAFGVLLLALAAHFAKPLLPGGLGALLVGLVLTVGGLFLLVVERTGHQHPGIDRVMRLVCTLMIVVGTGSLSGGLHLPWAAKSSDANHLAWEPFDRAQATSAIAAGRPVIIDFSADWCVPCKELDVRTFADPRVAEVLSGYARYKVDQTKASPEAAQLAADYKVVGVPTVIVYRSGAEVFRITGFEPPDQFLERLQAK
jgi:thioredoxin:protein disulfide reductase